MRKILQTPVPESERKKTALAQARDLYRLHEAGKDYTEQLQSFSETVGTQVTNYQVDSAFGSIRPESFAEDLLASHTEIPMDLEEGEMLELIEHLCTAKGTTAQQAFWLRCLIANTGDDRISGLIFWPGEYFGDGDNSRELTPKEILDTALKNGKKKEQ